MILEKQGKIPLIDVRSVIRGKSKALGRYLPGFIIRYLERIIHQDEVNYLLETYGSLAGLPAAKAIINHLGIKAAIHGLDQIPVSGRYVFVSNHPLGGLDGGVLTTVVGERFKNVKFIVNDLLLNLKPFEDIFIPVNKHGHQNKEYAQRINDTYKSDSQIIYFPSGMCSRKTKGVISDPPWSRNVLQKAIKYQRDIVPVFFSGNNSRFFYRLANIRTCLHIPLNLEMLYLSDEVFRQRNGSFDVYFGTPIPYDTFTPDKSADHWIREVRNTVYSLPQTSL